MLIAPTHSAGSTRDTDTNTYEGTQVYTRPDIVDGLQQEGESQP